MSYRKETLSYMGAVKVNTVSEVLSEAVEVAEVKTVKDR